MSVQWFGLAFVLLAGLAGLVGLAGGCGLQPTRFDPAARQFSDLRDMPAADPRAVRFEVTAAGECERDRITEQAGNILGESGRFQPASAGDKTALTVELNMEAARSSRCRIKTQCTACNLSMRYLLPVHGEKYECVATANVKTPDGKTIAHCEARGRGKWAIWFWDTLPHTWFGIPSAKDKIHRKTLKALTVKVHRALAARPGN